MNNCPFGSLEKTCSQMSLPPTLLAKELYSILPAGKDVLLMLDYDGTLVPFKSRPEEALPGDELVILLKRLAGRPGLLLALLSGRSQPDLENLLPLKGVTMVFCHGAILKWPSGEQEVAPLPAGLSSITALAEEIAAKNEGFLIENKKYSLAIHYRLVEPSRARILLEEFKKRALHIIKNQALELLEGEKVLEIRPAGINKGEAAKKIMTAYQSHYPIYLGDDTTDEDAFKAVKGRGLGVLVREENRPSFAVYHLAGWREAREFLRCFLEEGVG